jgi:hypothetical protein
MPRVKSEIVMRILPVTAKVRRRVARGIAAAVLSAWVPFAGAAEKRVPSVLVGAIRWDNWRLDSTASNAIANPAFANRIPYYAWRRPDGKLGFPGDMRNALSADVEYARAAGIDYFIFGYYLETGTWGRNREKAKALNRAFRTYLNLPDRAGVKFALSFNWSFPPADVPAVSSTIAEAAKRSDQMRTADGAVLVFFFTPNVEVWAKGLGGEDGARQALAGIRRRVAEKTGERAYFVALLFGIDQGGPLAKRLGFDAISTYAAGLADGNRAVPYATCATYARNFWTKAEKLDIGFLPNVSFGWDKRPIQKPSEHEDSYPSWCTPATDTQWTNQLHAAVEAVNSDPHNDRIKSVVLYAWNEFAEGGWISPTVGEGVRRLDVIRRAFGRNIAPRRVELRWPRRSPGDDLTIDWPGPPGSKEKSEADDPAPPNADYAVQEEWRTRVCN